MLQWFRKKSRDDGLLGLSVSDDRIVMAQVTRQRGEAFLSQCARLPVASQQEAHSLLSREVDRLGLRSTPCNIVLSPADYNLYLVEAPPVEPEEIKSAVRWKIKDLLDIPAEDAVIDVFPVPEDAFQGRSRMLYVVAAHKARVQQLIEISKRAELELVAIDIPELAMRNLSTQFANDDNGVALMALRSNGSSMNLSRRGSLYLTRRINTQVDDDVMASPDWESLRDRLVLEIQRSLDYYESQMGQSPISRMLIAPRAHDTEALVASLNDAMSVQVSAFNYAASLNHHQDISPETQYACMVAIGAALRSDEAGLGL